MATVQAEVVAETATAEDFSYPEHAPDWLILGSGLAFCRVCGRFPNGIYWGKAPGQPRLPGGAEDGYLRETGS